MIVITGGAVLIGVALAYGLIERVRVNSSVVE